MPNDNKILIETIAENTSLRKELSKLEELHKDDYNNIFRVIDLSKAMTIRGVLIAEGVWKGVKYPYEQMKASLSKFRGLPLMIQHGHTQEFGENSIGRLSKVEANDMLRCVTFEAEVTNIKAQELVKNGTLDAVSVRGKWDIVDTSLAPPVGNGYSPIELSLTSSPACEYAQIFNYELELSLSKNIDLNKRVDNMTEIFISKDDVLKAPELTDIEEGKFEIIKESDIKDQSLAYFKLPSGYYPDSVMVALKSKEPKYPYYGYSKYSKEPIKVSSDKDTIESMDLADDYKTFMTKCVDEGGDIKSCSTKWKEEKQKIENPDTPTQPGTPLSSSNDEEPVDELGWGDSSFPDSSFAFIPESAKGKDGNKSERKLPYKDKDGNIDLPHVRNALARLSQTQGISQSEKDSIKNMLENILKKQNDGLDNTDSPIVIPTPAQPVVIPTPTPVAITPIEPTPSVVAPIVTVPTVTPSVNIQQPIVVPNPQSIINQTPHVISNPVVLPEPIKEPFDFNKVKPDRKATVAAEILLKSRRRFD
jgi:hypothetical protein